MCQRNYSILDKEWLAILEAITRVWKHWLTRIAFEVHTDHAPLQQILTKKAEDLTPRQLRWLEKLEPFSYTVIYIKGGENIVADALSRQLLPQQNIAKEASRTLQQDVKAWDACAIEWEESSNY